MTTTCNPQSALIDRYVRELRVRTDQTRQWYANEIHAFYRFVSRTTTDGRPTDATVIAWIRERLTEVSEIVVYDRARKIHCYLQYLVEHGHEAYNPFAQLCERHGERCLAPILRAAAAAEPAKAFAGLIKPEPWSSSIGPIMRDHVALMRSVGYRYLPQESRYRSFDRFLQSQPGLAGKPLETLIEAWADAKPTKGHRGQCELVGRLLSRAMNRLDPRPYIYSAEELARLFSAARALRAPRSPLLPSTVYTMLVLAYCAGLRLGELACEL